MVRVEGEGWLGEGGRLGGEFCSELLDASGFHHAGPHQSLLPSVLPVSRRGRLTVGQTKLRHEAVRTKDRRNQIRFALESQQNVPFERRETVLSSPLIAKACFPLRPRPLPAPPPPDAAHRPVSPHRSVAPFKPDVTPDAGLLATASMTK